MTFFPTLWFRLYDSFFYTAYIADLDGTNYPCDELDHMRVLELRRG